MTVTLNSFEWYPVVEVDGLFALPDEDEEDDELLQWSPDQIDRDTAQLLLTVFGDGGREPMGARRIVDGQDRSWEFCPRLVS